jgi:hypothetical protein
MISVDALYGIIEDGLISGTHHSHIVRIETRTRIE